MGGGISGLQNLDNRGWVSGSQANVFVANHDTERVRCHHFSLTSALLSFQNGGSLRYDSPSNTYITATIFSLAHPYGTPTIISSYSISDNDAGPPNNGKTTLFDFISPTNSPCPSDQVQAHVAPQEVQAAGFVNTASLQ